MAANQGFDDSTTRKTFSLQHTDHTHNPSLALLIRYDEMYLQWHDGKFVNSIVRVRRV